MADHQLPRPASPCIQARTRHTGRQGLRVQLGQADDWNRPDRLDDRPTVRGCLREAWSEQDKGQAHDRAFFAAKAATGAAKPVLILRSAALKGFPVFHIEPSDGLTIGAPRAPSRHESRPYRPPDPPAIGRRGYSSDIPARTPGDEARGVARSGL